MRLAGHASAEGEGGRGVPSGGPQPEGGKGEGLRARTEVVFTDVRANGRWIRARATANDDTISLEEARAVVVSMKGVSLDDGFGSRKVNASKRRTRAVGVAAALAVLTRRENPERDAPAWTEFPSPAVDCGTLFPGETRRFRRARREQRA